MHRRLLVFVGLLGGCAGASPPHPAETSAASAGGEDVAADVALPEIALYEARLAEADAENAALRAALSSAHRARAESCAGLGDDEAGARSAEEDELASGDDSGDDSRPVLRLYGPPETRPALRTDGIAALAGPEAPSVVAAPPVGALGRLVVTADAVPAIPATPITVAPRAASTAPGPADPAVLDYQAALRLVSERQLDLALAAFATFVAAHPTHAYADNALYWRAEVFYARHDWTAAVRELETLLLRFPSGSKVPDALLRLGMCWERLGDSGRARTYFERVLAEHPLSTAAHMASREDT